MAVQSARSQTSARAAVRAATRLHWPECLIEATCLGLFMVSVCIFGALFEHPASPVRQLIESPTLRRIPMGLAMGLTAMALIYSRLGQRSGAHMNPATTLAFLHLGKVTQVDAIGYVLAQVAGGILGVQVTALVIRQALGHPAVNYLATVPGMEGTAVAFAAEVVMSCVLMLTVLAVSNRPSAARFTGLCAGILITVFIIVEAPISGMSMNPARSLGSAVAAGTWTDFWIYLAAPPLGTLLAAELYLRAADRRTIRCAKLHHPASGPCHFNCAPPASGAA
jgi:aquaporin Z